jgi:8-amino-7-oxononanoate synthase
VSLIQEALARVERQGTYRTLRMRTASLDFSSNDYLGLSSCGRIRAALVAELEGGCPLGATGSRSLSGHTPAHERVESFLSSLFGVPSALLFSSGFLANLGLMNALGSAGAHFFSDESNHASLIDGIQLSRRPKTIFRHNDLSDLEAALRKFDSPLKVIVTESVFSMDGDLSPLKEMKALADRLGAWLVVDEAHSTGIFGPRGLGRIDELGLHGDHLISIHTGGKALGGQGAFVLSNAEVRELIVNQARGFIFSTALAPLSALQIEFSLREVVAKPFLGAQLLEKAKEWRESLPRAWDCRGSQSQIVPLVTGSNEKALRVSAHLEAAGFDVRAVRAPAVPEGLERLRLTLKSHHGSCDLARLKEALAGVMA